MSNEVVFRDLTETMAAHRCLDCIRLKQVFSCRPVGPDRFEVTVTGRRVAQHL